MIQGRKTPECDMPVTKKDPDPKRFGNKGTLSRLNKVRIKERIIREVYARPCGQDLHIRMHNSDPLCLPDKGDSYCQKSVMIFNSFWRHWFSAVC